MELQLSGFSVRGAAIDESLRTPNGDTLRQQHHDRRRTTSRQQYLTRITSTIPWRCAGLGAAFDHDVSATAANGGVPTTNWTMNRGGLEATRTGTSRPVQTRLRPRHQPGPAVCRQIKPDRSFRESVYGPVEDFTLGGWIGTPSQLEQSLCRRSFILQKMAA